jgi:hypothetical protein
MRSLGYSRVLGGAGNYSVRQFGDTACFSRIELIDTPYHRCARTMHTCQWTPSMPQRAAHALACNSAVGCFSHHGSTHRLAIAMVLRPSGLSYLI